MTVNTPTLNSSTATFNLNPKILPQTAATEFADKPNPSNKGKRIGILVVAYNAVTTIGKVLKRIPPEVWEDIEEIVVFDDASHDHTYELTMGLKILSELDKLTVIKNENNQGYGGNQKLGYRYFIDKGFDVVVLLHGDGQYAPEMLAQIYAPVVAGETDAVFGSRMMSDFGGPLKGGMPFYKFLGNKILTHFENRALGLQLTEFHSGYRAYSLATLSKIDFSKMTNDFHFDTEIIIKLHHQGFRIRETPIPTFYGDELCYVNGMKYARNVFMSVIRYKQTFRSVKNYPEFSEYFVHYPIKESRYSSHYYLACWVGKNKQVLDVGCGEGFFAERLVAQNNRVVGIDMLAQPQHQANFEQYLCADLDKGLQSIKPLLHERQFDRVLIQDILEHTRFPEQSLQDCRDLLKPDGLLLVSISNIANITIRLALLFGRFEYTERGILDKRRLRFFTKRSARRLLEQNGYQVMEEAVSVMPVELALGMPEHALTRMSNAILATLTRLMPGLFGYQILLMAKRSDTHTRT